MGGDALVKSVLIIGLLLVCVVTDATAQMATDVIILLKGQQQTLPFTGLTGASVGDINVIFIHGQKPNEVVIVGAGVGETSLEIFQRGGRKRRLMVRVSAAPVPLGPMLSQRPAQDLIPRRTPERKGGLVSSSEEAGKATSRGDSADSDPTVVASKMGHDGLPAKESAGMATIPEQGGKMPVAGRSNLSRLEISAATEVMADREQVRVLSADLLEPGKLQEAVMESASERFADGSKREQTMSFRHSSVVTRFSIKYEMSDRNSLTFIIPAVQRWDEIKVGASTVKTQGRGLGDVQVKFERSYPYLRKSAWDGLLEFNVGVPTGTSNYNARPNQSPLGTGHFEVSSLLGARRVFDPLAFNAAAGVSYTLPRAFAGTHITPGLGYQAQTGVVYSVTDKIGVTQSLQYTRSPNAFLSAPTDARTVSTDQAYLRHGIVLNPRGGHALQMTFMMGLNAESLNHGFGFRYSFQRAGKAPK
jgi:hypothetical protein